MVAIVEDLIRLLDDVGERLPPRSAPRRPHRPSRPPSCCARWPTSSSSSRPAQAAWRSTRGAGGGGLTSTNDRPGSASTAKRDAEAELRDQRHRDADEAADHPGQLQQRLGAGERAGLHPLGDVALDGRVERQLGQRLGEAGGEAEQRPAAAGRRTAPPTSAIAASASSATTTVTAGFTRLSSDAERDAEGVAEAGGADDEAEQQLGPVLPAGERVLAQQERHEHREEAGQQARPAVGAQRERDGAGIRSPGRSGLPGADVTAGHRAPAGASPCDESTRAGSRIARMVATDEHQEARSAATTPAPNVAASAAIGAETAAPIDAGQRDPGVGLDQA